MWRSIVRPYLVVTVSYTAFWIEVGASERHWMVSPASAVT